MRNKLNLIYIAHKKQAKIMKPSYKDYQPLTKWEKRILWICCIALSILLPYLYYTGRH